VIVQCLACGGAIEDDDRFCATCGGARPATPGPRIEPIVDAAQPWFASAGLKPTVSDAALLVPVATEALAATHAPTPGVDATAAFVVGPAHIKFRLLSWLIDGAIVVVAFVAANAIHQLLGVAALALGVFAYYVLLVGGDRHATVGHQVAKLSVVDAESHEPIDVRTATLRAAVNAVLVLPFGLPLLLNIPVHSRHQGALLHDLSTGTKVVRVG